MVKTIFKKNIVIDNKAIKTRKTKIFFKYILDISLNLKTNHQSKKEKITITNKNKLSDNQNSKLVNSHLISETK
ncbi:MAG: hypothetical protein PF487_12340 [Bacteroidales bacterium]|nr:hypothetical protein [Bacteroidales bacterium]